MNDFLHNELQSIVQKAAKTILQLKDFISEDWNHIFKEYIIRIDDLQNEEHMRAYFGLSIEFFWKQLLKISNGENMELSLDSIQYELQKEISEHIDPNQLIVMITMLEGTTHKIIKAKGLQSYYDKQAIQYLFFTFTQQLLPYQNYSRKNVDALIENLLIQEESPFLWLSIVKKQKEEFFIKEIFTHKNYPIDESWLSIAKKISTPGIEIISESLLRLLDQNRSENINIIPLTLPTETLLLCVKNNKITDDLLSFVLNVFKENESALSEYKRANDWKDALILFDELIMQANSLEDAIDKVTSGLIHYLPFERTAIFSLMETNTGTIGIGKFGKEVDISAIQTIREDLANMPMLLESLENIQPLFVPKAEAVFPPKYVEMFELESTVFLPLYSVSKNRLWGAMILDQGGGKKFELTNHHISALMKFGCHAAEILVKYSDENILTSGPSFSSTHLSPREHEILKLMASGNTIDEAADQLFLSKYTVRDYVSEIIKKMNAKNRTHAVAAGIRQGII